MCFLYRYYYDLILIVNSFCVKGPGNQYINHKRLYIVYQLEGWKSITANDFNIVRQLLYFSTLLIDTSIIFFK